MFRNLRKIYNIKFIKISVTLIFIIIARYEFKIYKDLINLNKSTKKEYIIDNSNKIISLLKNIAIKKNGDLIIPTINYVDNTNILSINLKSCNINDIYNYIEQILAKESFKELQNISTQDNQKNNKLQTPINISKTSQTPTNIPFVFQYLGINLEGKSIKPKPEADIQTNEKQYKYEANAELKLKD